MEEGSLEGLFTNEEYESQEFKFGDVTLQIMASSASSTDYDLTGQILWPAARLLAEHLAKNTSLMEGRVMACELGSGLGLTGLLCGQFCDTVLTDHNAIVLRVLQENVRRNPSNCKVRCQLVDWESEEDISDVKSCSPNAEGFDLVLGADICYSLKALPFIFRALSSLLAHQNHALGLLGYVSRAAAIDRGIYEEAVKAGLELHEIQDARREVGGGLQGYIYTFRHADSLAS